jgi:uncharacterized protein
MILYADTSALLKLYIDEEGSAQTHALITSSTAVYTHIIAYAELCAALAKALRMKRITRKAYAALARDINTDWSAFNLIEVEMALVHRAGKLAQQFHLRGFDSVHLAAAERAYEAAGRPALFMFAAFDHDLRAGAQTLGLNLLP